MNKYKICVYAICKNESAHINRWVNSMKEADEIYVLDTGSTDNSVELLKNLNVHVYKKEYDNFKFDEARNDSLNLVPEDADICVCTDIDEVLSENWRKNLEEIWDKDTSRIRYKMNFSFDDLGNPVSTYYISKIHKRFDYIWTHPIHEVITYKGENEEKIITTDKIEISHYPDKSKDRSFYLTLLEQSVKENPNDDRNMHYLGREYMYVKRWNDCIDTLIKHIYMPSSHWNEEKSASMRYIARAYHALNRFDEAIMWFKKAIDLTPYLKEGYVELAFLYYELKDYMKSIEYAEKSLYITKPTDLYINESFAWNETPYEILSVCYFKVGKLEYAKINAKKALELSPNKENLKKNYEIISKS